MTTRISERSSGGTRGRSSPRFRFRPRVEELTGEASRLDLAEALSRLRERRAPVLFDSAGGAPARFSLLAFDPLPAAAPETLGRLAPFVEELVLEAGDPLPDFFHGGFLGALAYDLGVDGEEELELPPDPWGMPGIVGGLYVDFLVRDERAGRTWLVLGEEPGDGRKPVAQRAGEIRAALARADAPRTDPRPAGPLERRTSSAEHRARVEAVREQVAAGEIYQANISHRLVRAVEGDPVDLYLRLRRLHPGPYLGFLRFDGGAVLSGSPELLLDYDDDGTGPVARTRPIKGTIARDADPVRDARAIERLRSSEKDLAELAMIVDLERNDLGRVSRPGGVRVEGFPRVESYATVHHLVADVVGRPAPGIGPVDVLASLFPGGSITGAPKLRSMEVIAELEGEGRGFAYGSLCLLDTRGRLLASILIRTLLWRPLPGAGPEQGEVSLRVGGGITWPSEAAAEEEEARLKGAALLRALEGPAPGGHLSRLGPGLPAPQSLS